MSAVKRSISMPQTLYAFAMRRVKEGHYGEGTRGLSKYLQDLIKRDMGINPHTQVHSETPLTAAEQKAIELAKFRKRRPRAANQKSPSVA